MKSISFAQSPEQAACDVRPSVRDHAGAQAAAQVCELQLRLFALVAFPIVLPQMTKLITGHAPDDPKFLRRQKKFLRQFSKLLYPDDER